MGPGKGLEASTKLGKVSSQQTRVDNVNKIKQEDIVVYLNHVILVDIGLELYQ